MVERKPKPGDTIKIILPGNHNGEVHTVVEHPRGENNSNSNMVWIKRLLNPPTWLYPGDCEIVELATRHKSTVNNSVDVD
ncbi:hypothetical protein LCGC14_0220460 [marine sediment metagenome]|uniref:Uncharacterized protein n=1 Tax=marine sediment metagenome TaxID=412755 RepID=A0A0F9UDB7_9ZZZZ